MVKAKSSMIIIRTTRPKDINFIYDLEHEPENSIYVGQWTMDQHLAALMQRDMMYLIIQETKSKKPIGFVILAGFENPNKSIELKRIVIDDKGKGYGRETLKLIKEIAFFQLNAHRLWLDVRYGNLKAINLYQSEKFSIEGILRDCVFDDATYDSLVIMSILESEYVN